MIVSDFFFFYLYSIPLVTNDDSFIYREEKPDIIYA